MNRPTILKYQSSEASTSDATITESYVLRVCVMSKFVVTFLFCTFAFLATALAAPPVRQFDGPGAPPFKVLKPGESPPLDAYDNFVIGPKYVRAPERKVVEGVARGKVQQFTIDSKQTKIYNPGIARKKFGTVSYTHLTLPTTPYV